MNLRQCFWLAAIFLAGCAQKSKQYNPKNQETAHIYFGQKVVLEQDDIDALNELVDIYNQEQKGTSEKLVVMVTGYTSKDGSLASNRKIASKRAKIVADYLKSKKVDVCICKLDDPRIGDGKKSKAASRYALCVITSKSKADAMCNSKMTHNHVHVKKNSNNKKPYKPAVAPVAPQAPVAAPVVAKPAPAPAAA